MRKKVLAVVFAAALLAAMAVPLFGGVVPTALANKPIFDTFDMNDRFASETGANGSAAVRHTQEGSIEIKKVLVQDLLPNHEYEVIVTVSPSPPGDFDPILTETSAPITSNANGHLVMNKFNVGSLAPGDYRVDIFVTHDHSTGPDPFGLDRDILLACQPFPVVTVE